MSPQLGWTRARTYFSLVGEFSPGPLLWLALVSPMWLRLLLFGSFVCFLTSLSVLVRSRRSVFRFTSVMEMMGFEPMTPCLQGRCSPNWATPPCWLPIVLFTFVLSFYNEQWMNLFTQRLLWKRPHLWGIFKCLPTVLRPRPSVMQARLTQNWTTTFSTPIWFRVGTRISRSP